MPAAPKKPARPFEAYPIGNPGLNVERAIKPVKYGIVLEGPWENISDLQLELICYRDNRTPELGGLGRYKHLRNAIWLCWPELKQSWNDWADLIAYSWSENNEIGMVGCGAAGKTTIVSVCSLMDWACSPHDTAVFLTSTSLPSLRARVWGEIRKFYMGSKYNLGGKEVNSKTMIQSFPGDDQHGIFGIPVDKGKEEQAVGKIQGRHPARIVLIIDEMPQTPTAIVTAASNLSKGAQYFKFVGIGNPVSRLDEHGKMCEPKDGWDSVDENTEIYETKRGGICLHFNAFNSPNVKQPGRYPFLQSKDDIEKEIRRIGIGDPRNDLRWWSYVLGWWAPDSLCVGILSELMIKKSERHLDLEHTKKFAGLDPAFEGGDRIVLRIGEAGAVKGSDGKVGVNLLERVPLKVDRKSQTDLHYQIAEAVEKACEERGIPPECFGLDSTGEGGGLYSIICRIWAPRIRAVEFGGKASDRPVSQEDSRPARELYKNRSSELNFTIRQYASHNQLGGLDPETGIEFKNRTWETRGKVIQVQSKKEYKEIHGYSPDNADAICVLLDVISQSGYRAGGYTITRMDQDWINRCKETDIYSNEDAYLAN